MLSSVIWMPKNETMIQWAMNSNPWDSELRNDGSIISWRSKYRHHGQHNGDKPEWRNQRKQERRFKELQFKILADNEDEFMDYMIEYNMVTL